MPRLRRADEATVAEGCNRIQAWSPRLVCRTKNPRAFVGGAARRRRHGSRAALVRGVLKQIPARRPICYFEFAVLLDLSTP